MDRIALLSVIIITYHRNKELLRCMDSCLTYIDMPFEIIVVDNGGSAACKRLTDEFSSKHHIAVTYACPGRNLGVSGGRNLGMQLANSKVAYLIDDDAWIVGCKDSFRNIVEKMYRRRKCVLFSNPVCNINFGVWMLPPRWKKGIALLYFCGASHFVFRDRLPDSAPYPEILFYGHEDLDLSLDIWAMGGEIGWTDEIIVWHSNGGRRGNYERERFYAIGNKYAVKAAHFPWFYQARIFLGFLKRCLLFWKGRPKGALRCIRYGLAMQYRLRAYVHPLSPARSRKIIRLFGKRFLTEVSHSGTDAKPRSATKIYEE